MIEQRLGFGRRSPEWRARNQRGVTGPDADILTVEGVAKLLHCSVDKVRRIPKSALPARRSVGKHVLYLRSEVLEYVRLLPKCDARIPPDNGKDLGSEAFDSFISSRVRSLTAANQ